MGVRGPKLEHWKSAVVDDQSLPPIQPGEHMTVGQVRHPEMKDHFKTEFEKWHFQTKTEMIKLYKQQQGRKKKQPGRKAKTAYAYDDDAPCAPWLIQCLSTATLTNHKEITEFQQSIENEVASLLGWSKITNRQLRELLQTYSADDALKLLLRGSTQHGRASREQFEKKRKQKQLRRKQLIDDDDEDTDGSENEEDDAIVDFDEQHSWFQLMTDIPVDPSVRVGEVPEADERDKLRGAKGIWATEDVPANHILGPYRHYLMFLSTYADILRNPRPGWEECPASWKLALDSYACDDDTFKVEKRGVGQYSLSYSAWGYGNATAYANDPHTDPIGSLSAELPEGRPDEYLGPKIKDAQGKELDGNCMCGVVSIAGWPYMFMFTTRPVKKGQEFLYSYGWGYWTLNWENMVRAVEGKEFYKLLDENKDLRQKTTQLTSGLTTSMQTATATVAAPSAAISAAAGTAASLLPAPAVSGLSSLGRNMQDMQLTVREPADQVIEQHRDQNQQEGVGESPAGKAPRKRARADESPAISGAGSGMATAEAEQSDNEDDASSVMPRTVLAYQGLVVDKQRQEQLRKKFAAYKDQQEKMVIHDKSGQQHDVTRVKDPRVAKLIHAAEIKLSRILYMFDSGIAFRKFKDRGWWSSELQQYEYDRWEFIRRRPLYFQMDQSTYSSTTVVSLTDEWRQELDLLAKSEGWKKPQSADGAQYRGRKRTLQVVYMPDAQTTAELQLKRQKLQEAESQLQDAQRKLQEALGLLQHIQQHLLQQRFVLPPHLQDKLQTVLQRRQESAAQMPCQGGAAAAAVTPQAAAPNADAGALAGFDLRGAPIPGMGGDGDSEYGSSEDEDNQQEPSADEDDACSDDNQPTAAAASNGRASAGNRRHDDRQSRRPAESPARAGSRPHSRQQPNHQARPHQPPNCRPPSVPYVPAQTAQHSGARPSHSEVTNTSRQPGDYGRMQQAAADGSSEQAWEQQMRPPYVSHKHPASHSGHSSRTQQSHGPQHSGGHRHQYPGYHTDPRSKAAAAGAWASEHGQHTAGRGRQQWVADHRQQSMHQGSDRPRHVSDPPQRQPWQRNGHHPQGYGS